MAFDVPKPNKSVTERSAPADFLTDEPKLPASKEEEKAVLVDKLRHIRLLPPPMPPSREKEELASSNRKNKCGGA